ncbi:MAG: hypothetical protein A2X08_06085 [Bacteroidetes bacterium GWA2_32_17]|nr:MAG: hypothetical protein A2X08_06085 [Bacteroidetes bacterium GWA2_32_17]
MINNNEITIRTVIISDIEELKKFFITAYGAQTIFQNDVFLMHYFDSRINGMDPMSKCLIGLNHEGEIVSHYGGLYYNLKLNNEIHSIIWGVSAYTLPEWRGKGINSKMVDYLLENNGINGVIGFTKETANFYKKLNYNIFNFDRFSRYILILDVEKTLDVIEYIKQDRDKITELKQIQPSETHHQKFDKIVELTKENIRNFKLNIDEELTEITTTHRTVDFLIWRFLENPFIKYEIYGFVKNREVYAYIALREEILNPLNYKVNRIIDLYGKKEVINILLEKTLHISVLKKHLYIDFSMYGSLYEKELISSKFLKLENEECCILPQVTAPIENRPNREYIGIQSKFYYIEIEKLSKENVYFTRMDSDRDRLAKISQINLNYK